MHGGRKIVSWLCINSPLNNSFPSPALRRHLLWGHWSLRCPSESITKHVLYTHAEVIVCFLAWFGGIRIISVSEWSKFIITSIKIIHYLKTWLTFRYLEVTVTFSVQEGVAQWFYVSVKDCTCLRKRDKSSKLKVNSFDMPALARLESVNWIKGVVYSSDRIAPFPSYASSKLKVQLKIKGIN